jgi:hypothetical protein
MSSPREASDNGKSSGVWRWLVVGLVAAIFIGGTGAMADEAAEKPILDRLLEIMDSQLPPGPYWDVTPDVCSIVSPELLDSIVGQRVGNDVVERQILTGFADVADGTPMWVITRTKTFQWQQALMIIITSSGECITKVDFERAGTL